MAVIHLHGGGFTGGSKAGVASSSRAFARLGFVSIASQYRLTGQGRWPAQIEDVKAAIRWTRANASKLDIDPGRIAVAGYSAGGLMALFAAGTSDQKEFEGNGGNAGVSSKVAACVAFYPAVSATRNLLPDGSDQAAIDAASATSRISASFAPTIFLHGVADTTIRPESSVAFFDKLRAAGVKTDLHLFQGAPHAFEINNPDAAQASAQLANLFFDRLINTWIQAAVSSEIRQLWHVSVRLRSLLHGKTSGYRRILMGTCRPSGGTREIANNTGTIRAGAKPGTVRSTTAWLPLGRP
jgi:acetyl esterase/lipase